MINSEIGLNNTTGGSIVVQPQQVKLPHGIAAPFPMKLQLMCLENQEKMGQKLGILSPTWEIQMVLEAPVSGWPGTA